MPPAWQKINSGICGRSAADLAYHTSSSSARKPIRQGPADKAKQSVVQAQGEGDRKALGNREGEHCCGERNGPGDPERAPGRCRVDKLALSCPRRSLLRSQRRRRLWCALARVSEPVWNGEGPGIQGIAGAVQMSSEFTKNFPVLIV